jgi:hypothetical protein
MLPPKIISVVKGSPKIKQTPPKQIKIFKMNNLVIYFAPCAETIAQRKIENTEYDNGFTLEQGVFFKRK